MNFSMILLVVIVMSGLFAYSLWLSSAQAVQKLRVEEDLAKLSAQIDELRRSDFSLPNYGEMQSKFEKSRCIVKLFVKKGDLDNAELLIKQTMALLIQYQSLRDSKYCDSLCQQAINSLESAPEETNLELQLGKIKPEVAMKVQSKLTEQGYSMLLTLDSQGNYLLIRPKPGCGPRLTGSC
jgi:hypothetical protein